MADNRSLDEFVGDGEPADSEPASPDATEPGASTMTDASDDDHGGDAGEGGLEPMAVTFAWSAAGGPCATCGETVEERWRDGETLVCGDCKAW